MRMTFVICPLNVLSDCSMDCSSPISAKTVWNNGSSDPLCTGICIPLCAIKTSRPTVLSETVFPPVFGPVITIARVPGFGSTSIGQRFGDRGGDDEHESVPGFEG